jgi:hypothetical protein
LGVRQVSVYRGAVSSVLKPVGPEDPQIYWRRRALVGGIVIVGLLLFWLVFLKGDPGPEPPPSTPPPIPTAANSPSPEQSSQTSVPSASASPAAAGGTCADSDITVVAEPVASSFAAGTDPQITMTIQNTGTAACERNIGGDANSIEISSGGVRVWSSDDCGDPGTQDIQNLEPGKMASVTVTWPRTISAEGCPVPQDQQVEAQPGVYDVVGHNLAVKSKKASFTLN